MEEDPLVDSDSKEIGEVVKRHVAFDELVNHPEGLLLGEEIQELDSNMVEALEIAYFPISDGVGSEHVPKGGFKLLSLLVVFDIGIGPDHISFDLVEIHCWEEHRLHLKCHIVAGIVLLLEQST